MGLHAGFHHVVLNLIFRSEYKYQLNKWSRALLNKIFVRGQGGGGPPSAPRFNHSSFYTPFLIERIRKDWQVVALSHA